MESASPSLIGNSWTSAERSPPLRANSAVENRHGGVLICQDLRLGDFETRVRPVPEMMTRFRIQEKVPEFGGRPCHSKAGNPRPWGR